MKCPLCGTWTHVLETREGNRRRRECANHHRFWTLERATEGIRLQEWARNQKIIADPRGNSVIARAYGISEARVRQIKKTGRAAPGVMRRSE